jgi:hypothetical protein
MVRTVIASFVVLISCLGTAGTAIPAEGPTAAPAGADLAERASADGSFRSGDSVLKKRAVSLGFLMIAGILVAGAFLLVLVVTWGNRTRRLARSPLPPIVKPDELWFLKPKKEVESAKSDEDVGPGGSADSEGGG